MPKPEPVRQEDIYQFEHTSTFDMGDYKRSAPSITLVQANSEEVAIRLFDEYSKSATWISGEVFHRKADLVIDPELTSKPRGISKIQFIEHVNESMERYREDAPQSLVRNNHMNKIRKSEIVSQRIIDAVLVDFVNFIAGEMGVDYGMYTRNLGNEKNAIVK